MDPLSAYHSRRDSWTGRRSYRQYSNILIKYINTCVLEHTKEQHKYYKNGIYFEKIHIINISTDIG